MLLPITLITIVINLALGVYVYRKNPNSQIHRLFIIITFIITAWTITNHMSLSITPSNQTYILLRTLMVSVAIILPAIFLISNNTPQKTTQLSRVSISTIILFTLGIQIITFTPLILNQAPQTNQSLLGTLITIENAMYLTSIIGFFIATMYLLLSKVKNLSAIARSQFQYLIFGIIITFIFIASSTIIFAKLFRPENLVILGPLYSLIFITTLAYNILKQKVVDIGAVVAKTATYTLLTTAIVTFLTIGSIMVDYGLNLHTDFTITIILSLTAIYLFFPLRHLVETAITQAFLKTSYDPEKFTQDINDITSSTISLNHLMTRLTQQLDKTLNLTHTIVVVYKGKIYAIKSQHNASPNIDSKYLNALKSAPRHPLLLPQTTSNPTLEDMIASFELSAIMPLHIKNKFQGAVLLGDKDTGEPLSNKDIHILESIAPQISLAIHNALIYDKLLKFNTTLKKEVDRATSDLRQANKNLRHLDKLKNDLIFTATHQLKNPVTAIKGYVSMFEENSFGKLPAKANAAIKELSLANQQLINLLNDLLQIARSEAKTLTPSLESVDVCQQTKPIITSLKPVAHQKGITLQHACPKKPSLATADPTLVTEILNNLLSNAIKYSNKGTITIAHKVENNQLVTHITDQGVGISKSDQTKIFTRFFRAEDEIVKGTPGTGLGLFIVRQLVEKMNGKIWFSSQVGTGSTFSFSLPLSNTSPKQKTPK